MTCYCACYHMPRSFIQAPPTAARMAMSTTLVTKPTRNHSVLGTWPEPKTTPEGPDADGLADDVSLMTPPSAW